MSCPVVCAPGHLVVGRARSRVAGYPPFMILRLHGRRTCYDWMIFFSQTIYIYTHARTYVRTGSEPAFGGSASLPHKTQTCNESTAIFTAASSGEAGCGELMGDKEDRYSRRGIWRGRIHLHFIAFFGLGSDALKKRCMYLWRTLFDTRQPTSKYDTIHTYTAT
jgi:hypothetical protein